MAANGDSNGLGDEEGWPEFDPFTALDDFDDFMNLMGVPDDSPFDWTEVPGNGANPSVDGSAPPAAGTAAITAPSSSTHQDAVAGSSASAHQGGLDCTGCQVLREIVHSNGFETTRLCIHGGVGVFYHATLVVYHVNPEGLVLAPAQQFFIDFMGRDYAWVKHYLLDYGQQRAAAGYTVVQDSTSDYHQVLCTSMPGCLTLHRREEAAPPEEADNGVGDRDQLVPDSAGDAIQPMIEEEDMPAPSGPPSLPNNAIQEQQRQDVRPRGRSRLSIQRERIKKLELRDISPYFHLPMDKACKELRVCNTALKKITRKLGIECWPHRTIQKIDTLIAKLRNKGNRNAAAEDKIQKLTDSRRNIIDGIVDPEIEQLFRE